MSWISLPHWLFIYDIIILICEKHFCQFPWSYLFEILIFPKIKLHAPCKYNIWTHFFLSYNLSISWSTLFLKAHGYYHVNSHFSPSMSNHMEDSSLSFHSSSYQIPKSDLSSAKHQLPLQIQALNISNKRMLN